MAKKAKTGGMKGRKKSQISAQARQRPLFERLSLHLALVLVVGLIAYAGTFSTPFVFDDIPNIVNNPFVAHPFDLSQTAQATEYHEFFFALKERTVGYLTFALNHALGGDGVFGYHVANLAIHLGAAVLVYLFVMLLLATPFFHAHPLAGVTGDDDVDHSGAVRPLVAFAVAMLFVSHPVQTQAVTYIVQRFASLAAFFYFAAITGYLYFRLHTGRGARIAYGLALAATILGMKTKETAFTLPVMLTLIECFFLEATVRRRARILGPFYLTMVIIPLSLTLGNGSIKDFLGSVNGDVTDRLSYLLTQFRVIVIYLRLLVAPYGQTLEYPIKASRTLTPAVAGSLAFLLAIAGAAIAAIIRSSRSTVNAGALRLAGFGVLWFFLALAVESSFVPIADLIFEHRLYLPSPGFFIVATTGMVVLLKRFDADPRRIGVGLFAITCVLAVVLGSLTFARNGVWADSDRFWRDVIAKDPDASRPHTNYGVYLNKQGMIDESIGEFRTAIALDPANAEAHNDLGNIYFKQKEYERSAAEYREAIRLKPILFESRANLANAYLNMGKAEEGLEAIQGAIRLKRDTFTLYAILASAYLKLGRTEDAVAAYRTSISLNPNYLPSRTGLAQLLTQSGRPSEAIDVYRRALEKFPDDPKINNDMGILLAKSGRLQEAVIAFKAVLIGNPSSVDTLVNLGNAYYQLGQTQDAVAEYRSALAIDPNNANAQANLRVITGGR